MLRFRTTPVYSTITKLTINQPPPVPVISLSGNATFCAGDKVTLSSSSATGHQWFKDGAAIAGATEQTYAATQSGSYTVKSSSNGCVSNASTAVVVTAQPEPSQPIIAKSQNKLVSSAPAGNQWYLNSSAISGATDTVYIPAVSGSYSVQVNINGCSSQRSNDFAFVVTTTDNPVLDEQIQVYPNPFNGQIKINNKSNETLTVQLFDVLGRLVLTHQVLVGSHDIPTTALAKGIYFIQIRGERTNKSVNKLIEKN